MIKARRSGEIGADGIARRPPAIGTDAGTAPSSELREEERSVLQDERRLHRPKVASLTGVRGVAALWVAALHLNISLQDVMGSGRFDEIPIVRSGYLGVDLFFVLSGFVIALNYTGEPGRGGDRTAFVIGRLFRVLPLHWFALTGMALLVLIDPRAYWGPGPFSVASFAACFALVQGWVGWSSAWNFPAWSLSAEWLAYVFFCVALHPLSRLTDRRICALLILLCLIPLFSVMGIIHPFTLNHAERAGMIRCGAEFFAGAILYRAWRNAAASYWQRNGLFVGALFVLIMAVLSSRLEGAVPFAFMGLVAACAWNAELATWLLGNRVTVFLGDVSFSIYLLHTIVFSAAVALTRSAAFHAAGLPLRIAVLVAAAALLVPLAAATWRYVEVPGQGVGRVVVRNLQRRLSPRRTLASLRPTSL